MSALLLLLSSLLFHPPAEAWKRIDSERGISFLVPHQPEKWKKTTDGMDSYIYQTKDDACVFGVVCTDLSKSRIPLTDESVLHVYEQMRIGSLAAESAILKGEQTVEYENMLIKEIEYSVIKDKFEMTYFKRFIFRENMIYQISIGGRSRHREIILEEKELFFNSVYFP